MLGFHETTWAVFSVGPPNPILVFFEPSENPHHSNDTGSIVSLNSHIDSIMIASLLLLQKMDQILTLAIRQQRQSK